METDYFVLRLRRLTADLPLSIDVLNSSIQAAQQSFEEQRREGHSIDQALGIAESVMLETITPILEAASRLKDILQTDFADFPGLTQPPHIGQLVEEFMPLLSQPSSRLADAYIVGLLVDYLGKNHIGNGI